MAITTTMDNIHRAVDWLKFKGQAANADQNRSLTVEEINEAFAHSDEVHSRDTMQVLLDYAALKGGALPMDWLEPMLARARQELDIIDWGDAKDGMVTDAEVAKYRQAKGSLLPETQALLDFATRWPDVASIPSTELPPSSFPWDSSPESKVVTSAEIPREVLEVLNWYTDGADLVRYGVEIDRYTGQVLRYYAKGKADVDPRYQVGEYWSVVVGPEGTLVGQPEHGPVRINNDDPYASGPTYDWDIMEIYPSMPSP